MWPISDAIHPGVGPTQAANVVRLRRMERPFRNVPEPHRGAVGDRAPGQPGGEEVARVDTAAADQAAEDAIRELFWRARASRVTPAFAAAANLLWSPNLGGRP